MSMTDEGTRTSNEPTDKPNPEKGSGQPTGKLPGLAAFGQMQGYTPVGGQPPAAPQRDPEVEAEPEVAAEPESDLEAEVGQEGSGDNSADESYAEQFAQDFVRDYAQEHAEVTVEPAPEHEQAEYAPMDLDQGADYAEPSALNSGDNAFTSEEIQNYMAQQHASFDADQVSPDTEQYDALGGAYDVDAGYPGDATGAPESYDSGNSLKTFEAHYDQHPEIPLGAFDEPGEAQGDQPFFSEAEQPGDADFLGGESASDVAEPKERRGRKALMAASGLIGVLALGGALAFAYKIGGDSDIARTSKPPLIQADNRPVKVAPDKPGGKEFPHANKKIYERLGGGKSEEVVKLQPRQEDVAAAATAAIGTSSDPAKADSAEASNPGGPRKVKTLTVRPDGTIEAPDVRQKVVTAPPSSGPVTTAPDGTITMSFPTPSAPAEPAAVPKTVTAPKPAETQVAAAPPVTPTIPKPAVPAQAPQQAAASEAPSVAAPPPVQKPAVPRVAADQPAAAPQQTASVPAAESSGSYVVQVAARKSQTDALATFADIQQKYPRLLDGYRPIIKRADLGDKGVWYRLNVGPVESKKVASALCSQLKSAGMRSCLVRSQ